ncbi:MAG: indole-3-glycerol phosphate synthase TrpC [Archaeoglobaceae archaeon]|nr:indole-3-glycerol phosphate synthase TrpC [Archaeoglobaceae archaeon]MCX8152671.1 indole-3-glycerol phosphate synthase TrpC [Archaeoglobaceae archaeon]MDW8013672.1 indole-3-glycerol phosphate synthase TrpC [Archaeoglobaceae archaeon]
MTRILSNKMLSLMIKDRKRGGLNPIIAEIKVYSPKQGDLLRGRDPMEILKVYESCKVAGISYITAKEFRGDFEVLKKICKSTELPVLRKDFIKRKDDIESSCEAEVSALLLIARILKDKTAEFVDLTHEHGMESLVEVHSEEDVRIALETKTKLVGINNRDIFSGYDGSVEVTTKISPMIKNRLKISESCIKTLEDLKVALKFADAALIGTAFMRAEKTFDFVKSFVEARLC